MGTDGFRRTGRWRSQALRAAVVATLAVSAACAGRAPLPPIEPVASVDLERFMGRWYVIAHIPTFVEDEAFNAIESYALAEDGTIATTFSFNEGGFDGPRKEYTPTGYVWNEDTKAEWGMEFLWPFESEYLIVRLDDDYGITVIGRSARDYVWIMARSPEIPAERYDELVRWIGAQGYDLSKLRRVPQRWE